MEKMLDSGGGTYELMNKLKFRDTGIVYPEEFNGIDLKEVDEGYGFELHKIGRASCRERV